MVSLWTWGIDTAGQPLLDAWWTPGWTSQNQSYIQVPESGILNPGFPPNLNYVTVTGSYFDTSANPLSGYLTFMPSSDLLFTVNGASTFIPQRYAGLNFSLVGINQMGDGKIYLQYGRLTCSLMATDNANMTPSSFTYHVEENFEGGFQYDITVPSADSTSAQDIRSLIIPGSIRPMSDDIDCKEPSFINISVASTQYMVASVADNVPPGINPLTLSNYPVSFAFLTGATLPSSSTTWTTGSWATSISPYYAQILIGPGAGGLVLTQGTYRVWCKINATPQVPVFSVGYLNIY